MVMNKLNYLSLLGLFILNRILTIIFYRITGGAQKQKAGRT